VFSSKILTKLHKFASIAGHAIFASCFLGRVSKKSGKHCFIDMQFLLNKQSHVNSVVSLIVCKPRSGVFLSE